MAAQRKAGGGSWTAMGSAAGGPGGIARMGGAHGRHMPPPGLETSLATPVAESDDLNDVNCLIPALKNADGVPVQYLLLWF